MAWMWARIHSRTTRLGTFVGGFQAFFDTLAAAVQQRGATMHLSTAVREIAPKEAGGFTLHTPQGAIDYDAVLSTTSPRLMTRLTPALPPDYLAQLNALKSMGAVVMILSLTQQLSEKGYYWHNLPKEAGFPFLAMCEHTNFVSPEHFGGDHLIYCGDYLSPDHEYFRLTEGELLDRFAPALPRFNPKFDRSWIKKVVAVPRNVRAARPADQSFAEHPGYSHAAQRPVLRLDVASLSVGSRHQLRRRDSAAARPA